MIYQDDVRVGGVVPRALADDGATKDEKAHELAQIVAGIGAMNPHAAKPLRDLRQDFETCRQMTRAFQKHLGDPAPVRELAVLREIYPARLDPIEEEDLFAGRFSDGILGHCSEIWGGFVGFYLLEDELQRVLDSQALAPEEAEEARQMKLFWREHATHNIGYREAYQYLLRKRDQIGDADWPDLPEHWIPQTPIMWFLAGTHRIAGPFLDGQRLVTLGVDGLIAYARAMKAENPDRSAQTYYDATIAALELFRDSVIGYYEEQARRQQRHDLADTLAAIRHRPPQTLREAMQLAWLYLLTTRVLNMGRFDVWFGEFYQRDLEAGALTEEDAQALVDNLWKLMFEEGHNFNTRVILGGSDREHVEAADAFALLCIEATRRFRGTRPQTTLRIYTGLNPQVYDAALNAIGEGCTFPMLLNDDVNIPAVATAFGVSEEEAAQYVPLGCGEFLLETLSVCSPNSAFPLTKCLEYALHDGKDGLTGHQLGPHTGAAAGFATFEQLWRAYDRQVRFFMDIVATKQAIGYQVVGREVPFLFISALYHDCLERGKALMDGGVRYRDGSTEVIGFVNTADSLTAIKQLVYDEQRYTLEQVVAALDANFVGHEALRDALLTCPKYGNDLPAADDMAVRVHEHACHAGMAHSGKFNAIRKFAIVHVNNQAHVEFAGAMAPSADGRRAHEPVANANNPCAGRDVNGTTAMLKSLAKITPDIHVGVVQNMKFSRRMFTRYREKTRALLGAYFALGGTQAMISVLSRNDLEDAMEHPERHQNLIVRVGGYSARFVDLSRDIQLEILHRTLHE